MPSGPKSTLRMSPPEAATRPSSQTYASCAGSIKDSEDRGQTSPERTASAIASARRTSSSAASCKVAPSTSPNPASESLTRQSCSEMLSEGRNAAIQPSLQWQSGEVEIQQGAASRQVVYEGGGVIL